jgi:hypothetical protein
VKKKTKTSFANSEVRTDRQFVLFENQQRPLALRGPGWMLD